MRRMVVAAVTAGVLAGGVGAAVRADDAPAPARSSARAADPAPLRVAAKRQDGRLPGGRLDPSYSQYRVHRARIAVRAPDPAGGPDWAVKVFAADRFVIDRPSRTLAGAGAQLVGKHRCAQLGRLRDGRFGWVYGDGRFRPTGILHRLLLCTPRARSEPMIELHTALKVEDPAAPEISTSAVWGLTNGARTATVEGTGGGDGPAEAARGGFLRVGGPDLRRRPGVRVVLDGRPLMLDPPRPRPRFPGGLEPPHALPGTERVEARAPDPAGGPGFGVLVARTREGGTCISTELQVVGDRLGSADLGLGLFFGADGPPECARPAESGPTPERPCTISSGFGNTEVAQGEDVFLRRARIERRILPGQTRVLAECHPDVERVTLQTPRDIRTLVPSPLGHVILAVYDGTFPAGELVLTAHLKGGRTRRERFPLGG